MENKETDEVEKLKTKFMSAWHNVKYSWVLKSKTCFSRNSPVFILGKCYHFKAEDAESPLASSGSYIDGDLVTADVEAFRRDFASRIWLTYREEFPALRGSALTSDCGWGCALRAGQMMLAQALLLHFLGRDWTWSESLNLPTLDTESWTSSVARKLVASLEASLPGERPPGPDPRPLAQARAQEAHVHQGEAYHRTVLSWFGDSPAAQLGMHRLVEHGRSSGKQAGDWYGPSVVAHILRKAVEEAADPELRGITVYVAQDCTVYCADVIDSHGQRDQQRPDAGAGAGGRAVIILVPVRLGGEKTNPEYFDFVKGILSLEYCVGIIGGKPKQAYYFVGFQDDSLIYMDPHYCQSFVDVSTSDFPLESFHCPSPKKMPFSKMDPSCTIGFYSRSVQDFEKISEELAKVLRPSAKEKYPAFTFMKGHGQDYDLSGPPALQRKERPFPGASRRPGAMAGDFVLL
ncbi:cysteine protease ATG4C [Anguilla rostrata]|uniref:cysteine protease ATG4C n=1 Tax=Anguilla rostrata TaxID=7938 RepID=UPI0030D2E61B